MTRKALIKVTGKQHYGADNDDSIELTTIGTIEETEDNYIIRYNEEQEPPHKSIRAKLSISKDYSQVEMMRSGAYSSCLIIERSKRNLCRYGTEYGDLLMGIYGKSIESDFADGEGTFSFGYDIDVNGALSSQNEVTVEIKVQ
ncbi:MAG: DUF1934 domain-containing protein [Eubacterium sp.]